MKVIILEDDRVEQVADGYARNYLLPKKLAIRATPLALASVEKRKGKRQAEIEKKRKEMQALADKLAGQAVTIGADVGEAGKLFGSITTADIAAALKRETGVEIDKRKIELTEPIKMAGEYSAALKIFQEITATLKIIVSPK